ncbi:acetamidase/formamidase family protein [Actinocorallia populi]|uniref:acetamidase/formamidase family protein n=1 Tax=Actinocorallia populi TaxID=2079200 RepID=UPI000D08FDEE|nr:acetamidase/formamidase family protein [Actinocorallia populi]
MPLSYGSRTVLGHTRWHPEIPAVAEVISGGSVRLECQGQQGAREALLCGPVAVVGAEPGDVVVVDVLGVGRLDGVTVPEAHPGVIGCAPGSADPPVGSCAEARLGAGSRIVLPVRVRGAKLSAGDLHFGRGCTALDGWIDLRVNLTKRGVERFHVTGPLLMPV